MAYFISNRQTEAVWLLNLPYVGGDLHKHEQHSVYGPAKQAFPELGIFCPAEECLERWYELPQPGRQLRNLFLDRTRGFIQKLS